MKALRTILVVGLALAGAVQVVRSAVVQATLARRPAVAATAWPGHPDVAFALTLADIGRAAGKGEAPGPESIARSMAASRRAPLSIEPFLIEGAVAQSEGQTRRAGQLFAEAVRRDPRSAAGRFLLSQHLLTSGQPGEGLRHAAVLVRLAPGGSEALVPAMAGYARSPEAVPTLRKIFAADPTLGENVLAELARDETNYALILALAGNGAPAASSATAPLWQRRLMNALVEKDDLARAHALWLRVSGLRTAPTGIFNPRFEKMAAPPPFNWTLGSGDFGFAEPAPGGGLQVIYYGRANAELASQTLLLPTGAYELRMRVRRDSEANEGSALAWTLGCLKGKTELVSLPLAAEAGGAVPISRQFTVPANCPAQTIRLLGTARDYPTTEQVVISDLQLIRRTS